MNNNGRLTDVHIEDVFVIDPSTGVQKFFSFSVWMDKSAVDAVNKILGVHVSVGLNDNYLVYLDPRYDREYLRREIEAQAKIHAEE